MAKPTGPKLTLQTLTVLSQFLSRPNPLSGADIVNETEMLTGTLYPILKRLEEFRWLQSDWEKVDPREEGRPKKRLYRLTGLGRTRARGAVDDLRTRLSAPTDGKPATQIRRLCSQ